MLCLELFSGSGVVSKVLRNNGHLSWTVDNNPKLKPDICVDINNFNYKSLSGQFAFIWASPPCTHFTRQCSPHHWVKHVNKYRNYNYLPVTQEAFQSVKLLSRTVEIISYLNPTLYIIENPVGRMRHLDFIRQFVPYRYSVNYKDFGFDYSKETDLYSNQLFCFSSKKVIYPGLGLNSIRSSFDRSVVPNQLVQFILDNAIF